MGEQKKSSSNRKPVVFIACSKSKRTYPSKARDLYRGSLFKKSLAYAEQNYECIYILSAKYGVVKLDQIIAPYDLTLGTMLPDQRMRWKRMIRKQMRKLGLRPPFIFFTGEKYCEGLQGERPLQGLTIGQRLAWLNTRLGCARKGVLGVCG